MNTEKLLKEMEETLQEIVDNASKADIENEYYLHQMTLDRVKNILDQLKPKKETVYLNCPYPC